MDSQTSGIGILIMVAVIYNKFVKWTSFFETESIITPAILLAVSLGLFVIEVISVIGVYAVIRNNERFFCHSRYIHLVLISGNRYFPPPWIIDSSFILLI